MKLLIGGKNRNIYKRKDGSAYYKSGGQQVDVTHMFKKNGGGLKKQYIKGGNLSEGVKKIIKKFTTDKSLDKIVDAFEDLKTFFNKFKDKNSLDTATLREVISQFSDIKKKHSFSFELFEAITKEDPSVKDIEKNPKVKAIKDFFDEIDFLVLNLRAANLKGLTTDLNLSKIDGFNDVIKKFNTAQSTVFSVTNVKIVTDIKVVKELRVEPEHIDKDFLDLAQLVTSLVNKLIDKDDSVVEIIIQSANADADAQDFANRFNAVFNMFYKSVLDKPKGVFAPNGIVVADINSEYSEVNITLERMDSEKRMDSGRYYIRKCNKKIDWNLVLPILYYNIAAILVDPNKKTQYIKNISNFLQMHEKLAKISLKSPA
mgnify:CR=1 FL=1|tara:strand:+ start:921 stop:2036 length:1116 start_codon:yes stop_codon:yes gene_type:complete